MPTNRALQAGETPLATQESLAIASLQTREPHQVGAQAEARTLARRQADRGRQQIQESERDRSDDGDSQDLLDVQLLLGDDEGGQRNRQTLQEVLNRAGDNLRNSEAVHLILGVPIFYAEGCGQIRPFKDRGIVES
jgi:hypothetical protein